MFDQFFLFVQVIKPLRNKNKKDKIDKYAINYKKFYEIAQERNWIQFQEIRNEKEQ